MSDTQTASDSQPTGTPPTGTFTVKVPDVGEGVAEVEIVSWAVGVGDTVARLQTVAEVMTDKATVEVPSPVDGVVTELGGAVGDVLLVGSPLIHLGLGGSSEPPAPSDDTSPAKAPPPPPERPSRAAPTSDAATAEGADAAEDNDDAETARSAPHPPGVEARPHATGAPLSSDDPAVTAPAPAGSPAGRSARPPARTAEGRVLATPAVRRRARDNGVDLRRVGATGPAGRVSHDDLDAYLAAQADSGVPVGGPASPSGPARVARTGVRGEPRRRAAPPDRPADGGVHVHDPAHHLRRRGRHDRARGAAGHAQQAG